MEDSDDGWMDHNRI